MATPREAAHAAEVHADDLSAYPNVVGIGTRPVDDEAATRAGGAATGADEGEHAVAVYVSRKVPVEQLDAQQRLPAFVEVAGRGGRRRVPVVVIESGVIKPETTGAAQTEGERSTGGTAAEQQEFTSE